MALKRAVDNVADKGSSIFGTITSSLDATGKFDKRNRAGSIVKLAKSNIFEFPVFIANSVSLDFATATVSLLEQVYASYLQMAISADNIVSADMVKNGMQFAKFKTDTNRYLEYTEMDYAHEACHNVITNEEDGVTYEFSLLSIEDNDAKIINEYCNYEPLSEFNHFFQEDVNDLSIGKNAKNVNYDNSTHLDHVYDPNNVLRDALADEVKAQKKQIEDFTEKEVARKEAEIDRLNAQTETENARKNTEDARLKTEKARATTERARKKTEEARKAAQESLKAKTDLEKEIEQIKKDAEDKYNVIDERAKAALAAANREAKMSDDDIIDKDYAAQIARDSIAIFDDKMKIVDRAVNYADKGSDIATKIIAAADNHKKSKLEMEIKKRDLETYDERLERERSKEEREKIKAAYDIEKTRAEIIDKQRTKAPVMIKDQDINKLNTMKPFTMQVEMSIIDKNDTLSRPIEYVVGVKCYSRIIDSEILPEVAEYPLKEMDRFTRKAKWRAGELKFFRDIVFKIKQKKQTAIDSKDPRRKWYRRLYELAHVKGDAPAAKVIQGGSLLQVFVDDKTGRSQIKNGVMPNASIIMSQSDVVNIKMEKGIDLLKPGNAKSFCDELFLMSLVIVDLDAESIKVLVPELHNDFEIHSIASINKQLATLDSASTKTREMFKMLG